MSSNPEIGRRLQTGGFVTNLHDVGSGPPLLMLHGSGPGVSAWANWRAVIGPLAECARVIAPDLLGFGYTERPADAVYGMDAWVDHALAVLDALNIEQADIVGNSFGGGLALAMAIRHPQRVRRLVLMGAVGVPFELTPALDQVWGYQPSVAAMRQLMDVFAWDRSRVTDELAELRYQASVRPGVQEAFADMFPAPRQRWVDALSNRDEDICGIAQPTLIIHGRDDRVIPLATSLRLAQLIDNSQLHVFGRCGHWTQIEHAQRFVRLVRDFVQEP